MQSQAPDIHTPTPHNDSSVTSNATLANASEAKAELVWYALRVTYNRELKVKAHFEALGHECFVPMTAKRVIEGDQAHIKLVPSVHNLLFVRISADAMRKLKAATTLPIRYIIDRGTHQPITVPDRQMKHFITVATHASEQVVYLNDTASLHKGDRVRITGGIFAGAEGTLLRIKGDRRVVVSIAGVVAVATTFVHPSLLEKIE